MLKNDFIKRIDDLGLSQKKFAEIVGYSYQAIKQWKDGKIPGWVPIVIEHLEYMKNNKELSEKYFR